MPAGHTHLLINALASITITGFLHYSGTLPASHPDFTALCAGLIIGSVWITPDIDMKGVRTAPIKAWGIFGFIWAPLLSVSKHRGLSHTYLRGPTVRLLYISLILTSLWFLIQPALAELPIRTTWTVPSSYHTPHFISALLIGYYAAQWMHLIADGIRPSPKRL